MTFEFKDGQTWLVREDKWRYPLSGIYGFDVRFDHWDGHEVVVTVGPVTDDLLDSLRVLKDELPDHMTLRIESA